MTNLRALALVTVSLFAACGSAEDDILTWDEFQAMAYQEPDTGLYVTNGDEAVESLDGLRRMYDEYVANAVAAARAEEGLGQSVQNSIVNTVNGQDDIWAPATAQNLTYCIDSKSLKGSERTAVVNAMNSATAAWEGVANVNFVYASAQDGSCTSRNSKVVFNVRKVRSGGQYLARAFFPSYARSSRELLIDATAFGNLGVWTLTGVLRHELGHTIGLRHEHTRPESGTCFENNAWRALTAYDSASVMHYPQCNGSNNGDLVITSQDAQGARSLYP